MDTPTEHDPVDCYSRSAGIFVDAEIDLEHARTLREWARYEFSRKDKERGIELCKKAIVIFQKLGAIKEVEQMSKKTS